MEIKKHYKLYKDGKNWCAMALAVAAVSAGLVLGNTNVKADTVDATAPVAQLTALTTESSQENLANQEKAAQAKDNGNYGYLDAAQVVNNNDLHVSGWQATNQAAGKDNRYLVAYDSTTNTELGRTQVTENVARPDVAKAYPDVVNAKDSGYQATMNSLDWSKVKSVDDQIHVVSRYSDAVNGEGDHVDNWSQPINLDKGNYAYLDNFDVKDNQLQVSGWNATNKALGKTNHYVILYDRTAGHEITRVKVEPTARPDVAKAYSQVINAKDSGFSTAFSLAGIDLTHELQIISRYSDAANGEGNYVSYWYAPKKFAPANTSNQGSLDSFNLSNGQLTVTGWHATDYSQIENNHYLILFDNTNKTQVKSIKVTNVARPDVAKVYPTVATAGQSGFNANFGTVNLTPGHSYSLVSRYSSLDSGNGDNGQSKTTDYWFNPVTLDQQASYVDSFTKTNNGYNVKGWMVSDQSINKPNAYLILLNDGSEIDRVHVDLTDRLDVAKVYPSIYNSQKSGFDVNFKVDPAKANGTLKVIMRFAGDDANQNYSDQYSQDYPTNAGSFDNIHVTANQVSLSGWHASSQAANKPYEWLIVLDNNGQELYRQEITNKGLGRNDVQNVYPYIEGANKSGFQVTMDIPSNMQGHLVRFINRFTDDKAGNGNYVDYYSNPVLINLQYDLNANKINRYILNNHINHANIIVNHVIPADTTGVYSETEDGKPNMVVVHETANPNDSIWGEINYEKAHYDNAFVHAFVDGDQIIEISSTDHEAWGAAYPANGRAVQFEQVEVYGANNFARELVNAAYYAAYKMNEYGMVPSLAQANGTGTLWSHHNVTQYIANGKTDHTDPDGYWTNRASRYFGTSYTMNDFFELVKYEYSHL
ncbi:KxYKxGKxW signal peptide domain-containing protein [Limosilactobacillus sp. WF-MT5-A]|uniref:N-acetylmuramoyl-L-alanine amidase n=2 Tax=Limosilactobacillus agrestis TaxID=2759748 RepID=UPI0015F9127A|nr:N-acetylmuramoyl-L-alanine amidase [Limosilactobacillus agrestis]MBB1100162.1 KxYKxGKxW signal peptide domain-containing protein [Limosilactobacillus agrestis]MCD7127313.1 KxYKxGKxW signal peptide domain-containing protein [Limosilactobacillus agrestis]